MGARLTCELTRDEHAPARARAALDTVADGLDRARLETARLLTSELVTNAVKYGDGDLRVELRVDERCLHTEVVDRGEGALPAPGDPVERGGEGGWGLPLVDCLADRWGAFRGSLHVWFELDLGMPSGPAS